MRTRFVSLAVSVLAIVSLAGVVSAGEADAMKERDRAEHDRLTERPLDASAQDMDARRTEEFRVQIPRGLRLETDQAMEQSSRALREATTQRGKKD